MRHGTIAVVTSGFPRRSETFALNELLALDARGMLAGIFATKPGEPDGWQPGAAALASRVEVLPGGTSQAQATALAGRLAGRRLSGLHAYFAHTPCEVARHAAGLLSVPFGFSMHARDARKVSPETLRTRAREARCVVACNPDVATELGDAGGSLHLVPHGVDLARFTVAPRPDGDGLHVLAVGRLVPKKGFDVLVRAVARLGHDVALRIVGEGPERPGLERLIAETGCRDRAVLAGARTHAALPADYAWADVVVVPSVVDASGDRDGLPNVVLEAMAAGRPVIGTRTGAISSAVEDGASGWLVDAGSVEGLVDALRSAAHPERRTAVARRARAVVEERFSLERCTDHFCRIVAEAYAH